MKSNQRTYLNWTDVYLESMGELSRDTWRKGIVAEIARLGKLNGTVLDLGGGTGVGSELLNEVGDFYVTAFDQSAEMLRRNSSADEKIIGDFSALDALSQKFDYIVSGFDSLNYLSQAQLPAFFKKAAGLLAPDGKIIFDYTSPKYMSVDWRDHKFSQKLSTGELFWTIKFEEALGRCHCDLTFLQNGQPVWSEDHYQYTISAGEMRVALQGSGLVLQSVRDLESDGYSAMANTHVYVMGRDNA